jgi:hypothetical protein
MVEHSKGRQHPPDVQRGVCALVVNFLLTLFHSEPAEWAGQDL